VEQDVDASKVSRLRSKLAPEGQPLAGHFGTYRPDIERLLTPALLALLSRTNANVLLAGHGSDHYHAWFTASFPAYQERVITTGTLPAFKLADTLSACDVLIEPYPDGISTRRGSAMTALALGLPVVTNLGRLSESLWTEGAVAIAESAAPDQIAGETLRLLADSERRIAISVHALELYHLRFDIRHTVAALLREPSPSRLRLAKVIA
jgi:glycosyltransferase involved in cell wall biosynthesis